MEVKEEKIVAKGNFYDYVVQELNTDDNYKYEYVKKVSPQGGAEVIPIVKCKDKNKLLCILNYRYPLKNYVLEFPGGCIDEGEDHREAAKREFEEETGIQCDELLGQDRIYFVDPWKSDDETNIFYTIIDSEKTCIDGICDKQKLDTIENIQVLFLDLDNLNDEVDRVVKKYGCKVSIK